MKATFEIQNGQVVPAEDEAAAILVYVMPEEEEKRVLVRSLGLDPYDVDSALDPDEVSRIEYTRDRASLIWKRPKSMTMGDQFRLDVSSVGLFLQQNRLVIILNEPPVPFPSKEFQGSASAADVLLRFLLHSIRHYVGHLKVIKQLSVALEAKISSSMENRYLLQMFKLSENLVYYLDAIESNGAVLTKLRAMSERLGLSADQLGLLDDIILENQQCTRQAEIYSTVLSGLMDARGTIVNNNMNVLLKNLTIINIIFLPLNLIASIGGMSEFSMMTNHMDWRVAYALFTLAMGLLGWVTWILIVRGIERRNLQRPQG